MFIFIAILVYPNIIFKTLWVVERAGEGMPEVSFQFLHNFFTIHTLYSYVYSVGLRGDPVTLRGGLGGEANLLGGNEGKADREKILIPIAQCFSEPLFYMGVYGISWVYMGESSAYQRKASSVPSPCLSAFLLAICCCPHVLLLA